MHESGKQFMTIETLNRADPKAFIAMMSDMVENSPWIAESLVHSRPFHSIGRIWYTIMTIILRAQVETQISLYRSHPELAGVEAISETLSAHSTREQGRLGLMEMSESEASRLSELNSRYRAKFDYPCIVALCHQENIHSIFKTICERLENDPVLERVVTLFEVGEIVRGRLVVRISEGARLDCR